jgi:phosphoglucosamine mutase
LVKLPQVMLNVRVAGDARGVLEQSDVTAAVARAQAQLEGRGRVFLRASGTEPLVRVTVEAADAAEVEALAQTLADVVKSALERS